MPCFISDDELERHSSEGNVRAVAEKADAFIRDLCNELETVKAQADSASITVEQTCSILEHKYLSLSSECADLQSRNSQLDANLQQRLSELAQVQDEKQQLHIQATEKDGEIERLSTEVSELHKSKRNLMGLVEQKDIEISEKNTTIKSYLDKIVNLTGIAAEREARLGDVEAELARSQASCERLSQEKELIESHNIWLNNELTAKVDSLMELRRKHAELEADLSAKLADVEKQFQQCSSSLKWYKERVKELEMKLTSSQEEISTAQNAAVSSEERYSAEIATLSKLVELYKESSNEWSKKAGELEGVIKALETHMSQVESEYKANLEKEKSVRKEIEKEAAELKEKLAKSEAEVKARQKASELNILSLSSLTAEVWSDTLDSTDISGANHMLVPTVPAGVSGTALAASLLRDGWSLVKLYAKYQEAVDALRHEQLGRKQSQAILERVLSEIEEKASVILDERAENERMAEAYSLMNQKLQQSLSEQATLQKVIQELKADLKRHERDYNVAQKEIADLQKQVTILLKECRDIQLRCGSVGHESADDDPIAPVSYMNAESAVEKVISEDLLTFKDINGLVEQNVKLRSLVRSLSDQIDKREMELKEQFEMEVQKYNEDTASKIAGVVGKAEEQQQMIESLHSSVAMYKRLYEEEQEFRSSLSHSTEGASVSEGGRKDLMLLLEGSQDAAKKIQVQASERVRSLEEDLARCRSEILSLRSERDKLALEASISQERLERFMKEFDHQREEINGILARNVEFSELIIDYQKKQREISDSLHAAEECTRKLTMEVSVLKHENELLLKSEKRACDEVRDVSERAHRLQASLDTIRSTEVVREEVRAAERTKQEEYIKKIEREWAEAKKELQEERDNVRTLSLDREHTVKDSMRRVDEMGKELSKALHSLTAAEARACVAEARYSDLERKHKFSDAKVVEKDGGYEPPSSSTSEVIGDLCVAKEEIERLKIEAQANKDHMLQYKSIAEVNEAALKQMENAHENFRIETDTLKKILEAKILSLGERVSELEHESSLRSKEVASAASEKEEALASALAEINNLKEENGVKMSQIVSMEVQVHALREDVEREQQHWRVAQGNYERQVVLQSETIQELTKTSQALISLQEEASELRKLADSYKCENDNLKAKWEVENAALEKSKNDAEKKCSEMNEQNKILHDQLESIYIKLAEKDRSSAGLCSTSIHPGTETDAGMQSVIRYLRRSKEIAETEISLLKQEKLQLQSQLERALKEVEAVQALLSAERANSRTSLFSEDEFKSLLLQVREMNLLRESNMQLREENKHNFEECQKLREVAHKAKAEAESILKERETEAEAGRKQIEMEREEKAYLEKRISELLERSRNIDVEDYDKVKSGLQQMQANMIEKDTQIEEIRKLVFEKEEIIAKLQQDLAATRSELTERENLSLQVEAHLKSDLEKQKKIVAQQKRRIEALAKEKESLLKELEEMSKENQALSKQLEDLRQVRKSIGDVASEQALREKEKEKEARMQILEKTLERQREEYRKEKEKRQNIEKAIMTKVANVDQERKKFEDEQERHKEALRKISIELEKLKHARDNLPEGTSVIQLLSGNLLDDLASSYVHAVENFENSARLVLIELGASVPAGTSSVTDTGAVAGTGLVLPSQSSAATSSVAPPVFPAAKSTEEREKSASLLKNIFETRKVGRKLVRPRLVKSEETQGNSEASEMEGRKLASTHEVESQSTDPGVQKRLATSSASELHDELLLQAETSSDAAAPPLKKLKGSEPSQEDAQGPSDPPESIEVSPAVEVPFDAAGDLSQDMHEEAPANAEEDDAEISREPEEEAHGVEQLHGMDQSTLSNDTNILEEEDVDVNEVCKSQSEQEHQPTKDIDEREEGELLSDYSGAGGEKVNMMGSQDAMESQPDATITYSELSPARHAEEPSAVDEDANETTLEDLNPEKNEEEKVLGDVAEDFERFNEGNDQIIGEGEADLTAEATSVAVESTITPATTEGDVTTGVVAPETNLAKEGSSGGSAAAGAEEGKEVSPAAASSTTINLNERARQRAMLRLRELSPSVGRGRGRQATRGRGVRGGRSGRRQTSGDQS
ncbi:hypothetical protein Nepgr_012415 [Nepenthes gracilis]|uniref:Nucleoprotein TPR/MLP1 domain-containing protein n=1 Tax=Nepenthes gracilis TaxID=150966 RepID=A0AAD3XN41_NEPGR|nr:hypothetical protein Nepgr_012415 [Nepenthes gracilis]